MATPARVPVAVARSLVDHVHRLLRIKMRTTHFLDYDQMMRTTVDLQPDVLAEVERLRRERGLGLSEAVNELARRGTAQQFGTRDYEHRSEKMGARIDITNISEVMDLLDEA